MEERKNPKWMPEGLLYETREYSIPSEICIDLLKG
jgi:hypothetical protein